MNYGQSCENNKLEKLGSDLVSSRVREIGRDHSFQSVRF